MKNRSRREFLKTATVAGAGFLVSVGNGRKMARANALESIAVAGIGVGGKGGGDIHHAGEFGKVVALCDVDKNTLAGAANNFPGAKPFVDFRDLFAEMGEKFDAVTVGTTDHMHSVQTAMALKAKKHCYTQKPLTRAIGEARYLGNLAREAGVCTQMGNQGSVEEKLRRNAAQFRAGVLGNIKEVHVRTDRPIWPQGPNREMTLAKFREQITLSDPDIAADEIAEKKKQIDSAMATVAWDLWLGVSPKREFWPGVYHPFAWRGWWDFGTGALGDMACHNVNMIFKGAELKNPTSVVATSSGHDFNSFPARSISKYEFPANDWRGPVTFYWYDSAQSPSPELLAEYGFPEIDWTNGTLVIGEYGAAIMSRDGVVFREKGGKTIPALTDAQLDFVLPPTAEGISDGDTQHKFEWFTAMWENKPEICWSNFPNHSGPLTETILLGNLAIWTAATPNEWGEKIEWDAEKLIVKNLASLKTPGVAELIRPKYAAGYDPIEV